MWLCLPGCGLGWHLLVAPLDLHMAPGSATHPPYTHHPLTLNQNPRAGSDLGTHCTLGTVFAGYHQDLNLLTIHGRSRCDPAGQGRRGGSAALCALALCQPSQAVCGLWRQWLRVGSAALAGPQRAVAMVCS